MLPFNLIQVSIGMGYHPNIIIGSQIPVSSKTLKSWLQDQADVCYKFKIYAL